MAGAEEVAQEVAQEVPTFAVQAQRGEHLCKKPGVAMGTSVSSADAALKSGCRDGRVAGQQVWEEILSQNNKGESNRAAHDTLFSTSLQALTSCYTPPLSHSITTKEKEKEKIPLLERGKYKAE